MAALWLFDPAEPMGASPGKITKFRHHGSRFQLEMLAGDKKEL
jgi:hypothetical protein